MNRVILIKEITLKYFFDMQSAYLEIARLLIVTNQIVFVKYGCSSVDEVTAIALEVWVFRKLVVGHTVQ